MLPIKERIAAYGRPIKTAIVGIGSIGKGLTYQCEMTPGFEPVIMADIDLPKAEAFARKLGRPYKIVDSRRDMSAAIAAGQIAVCDDGLLAAGADEIDVLLNASSAVYEGARHGEAALRNGAHVVTMNFESELMYGPHLLDVARSHNRVYTCADGDQPTVIKRMVDEITFWGFEPVMLGNIKGFHDLYSNPTKIAPEADKRDLDHQMCAAYTDGSKLGVEMATLANALNGRVVQPGMLGPRMDRVHDMYDHFDFADLWRPGDRVIVDYVLGAEPKGGVFAVGYTDDPFQNFYLDWFPGDNGKGPFFLFHRPYHLCHFEALLCVAEAVLDGTSRLTPTFGQRTNVIAYAKKDLQAGERLDGMGGFATYGLIENAEDNDPGSSQEGLPQLVSKDLTLKRDIAKDARIQLADCNVPDGDHRFDLWRRVQALGADA